MENAELDQLRFKYKAAVERWIAAIRAEENLATPDHSMVARGGLGPSELRRGRRAEHRQGRADGIPGRATPSSLQFLNPTCHNLVEMPSFADRLIQQILAKDSRCIVGLDPRVDQMPAFLRGSGAVCRNHRIP